MKKDPPLGLQYCIEIIKLQFLQAMGPHDIHALINTLQNHPYPIIFTSFWVELTRVELGSGFKIFISLKI